MIQMGCLKCLSPLTWVATIFDITCVFPKARRNVSLMIPHNMRQMVLTHNMREDGENKHVSAVLKRTCRHRMGLNMCME